MSREIEVNGCVSDPCTSRSIPGWEASLDLVTNEIHCGAVDLTKPQAKTEGGLLCQYGEGYRGEVDPARGGVCLQKIM